MSNRRPKPPSRTNTLPASLRAELVELGKLPAAGKSKGDRKEKRKIKRDESKTNRAKHFAEKKRKVEEVESEPEEVEEIIERPIKKSKIVPKPVEKVVEKKMTPLERLLAKQTMGTSSVDVKRKKNKVESTEDLEIAWLEAKLGVRGGPPESSKADHGKWNEEMEEDGLDGKILKSLQICKGLNADKLL